MPSQKRSRYLRQMARRIKRQDERPAREPSERQVAIRQASSARDKKLRELRLKYEPKLAELDEEWAAKRREVWKDYEERKTMIVRAHILEPAAAK